MIAALLLTLSVATQAPPFPDDSGDVVCLATGFCRQDQGRRPHSGMMFLAVGLVAAGVAGLRVTRSSRSGAAGGR